MQVHRTYPERKPASFWRRNRQDILRGIFLFAGYASLLVNLLAGGMPWSLIVIGGLGVIWIAAVYRPMVEHTLIKKMSDISIVVCLYLFLLSAIVGGDWTRLVVPIVFFADVTVISFFYLLFFKKQKRNFMPLFELVFVALIGVLYTLIKFRTLSWAQIVLGSVSLGVLVLTGAIFPKKILLEIRKKLHW